MSEALGCTPGLDTISSHLVYREILREMRANVRDTDAILEKTIPASHGLHARVHEAMRHALFSGGKRLRPFLVLQSAKLFGVDRGYALRVAAAIEALHTYSLVHDDLPCMDDDDLRRGKPTVHVAFDEATAVLAGDALLTAAFGILSDPATHPSAQVRCRLVARLAEAAGSEGLIGGQMIDMEAPNLTLEAEQIAHLQRMKTGALFEFACEAGAILAEADGTHHVRLRAYARDFGLTFQITDDLLDVASSTEWTGKAVGKDSEQGKATFLTVYGVEGARDEAGNLARRAAATMAVYGAKAELLGMLPFYLLDRKS